MLSPETRLKDRYRILHQIGGGGFGYVYKAVDETFGCCVAIKETKEQVAGLDQLRKAFEREAKLLRNLKHECLPRVTDYFFHKQTQFLVMDFIEGEDLATRLKKRNATEGPFTVREVLLWADKVLSALEYLHTRPEPIIHRDLKPANIKLTEDGEIYLLDFGLAKGAAGQMSTVIDGEPSFSLAAFTHEYASLEQLQSSGTQPHSDIYGLGATLYHLLTGQVPISAALRDEAAQRGHGDPLKPAHEIRPTIPVAVSQIISQAMTIRWWDRLSSAGEMRAALRRAATTLPIPNPIPDPQPVSPNALGTQDKIPTLPLQPQSFELSKQGSATTPTQATINPVRSHRTWLIAGLSVVVLTAAAIVVRLTFPHWFVPATSTTQSTSPPSRGANAALVTPTDLRPTRLPGHTKSVFCVAFSPDGTMAASGSEDTTAILWDTKTWQPRHILTGHSGPVYSVAFSPDNRTLATASADKTIRLWDTQNGTFIRLSPHKYSRAVQRLSFSSDGEVLASISGEEGHGEEQIQLWYLSNNSTATLSGHNSGVQAIAFVPSTKSLFSSGYEKESGQEKNTLRLWDMETRATKDLKVYLSVPQFLAVSYDGKNLACGTTRTIDLWSYQSGTRSWEEQRPLVGITGAVTSLAFSPDNKTLIATTDKGTIIFWDITSPSGRPTNLEHDQVRAFQWSSAFSPDAQTLLTGGNDQFVWLWRRPNISQ